MLKDEYQYVLNLYKADGSFLGRFRVAMDWQPALDWTRFTAIRRGVRPPVLESTPSEILPIWDPALEPPYLTGVRAVIPGSEGRAFSCDIPAGYFTRAAKSASRYFVKTGDLQDGESFHLLVAAFPREEEARAPVKQARFSVDEIPYVLPLKQTKLASFKKKSLFAGEEHDQDIPVFIPARVLSEAARRTREAGVKETGGVLAGFLHRDASIPELFLEVSAQIPAKHERSELARLTFTADTWAAARAAIHQRGRGESMIGWWHSHSYLKELCKTCDKGKEDRCRLHASFMSDEDCHLHRGIFSRAYHIALVVSDSPCAGITFSLFGWRHGALSSRGFHMLEAAVSGAEGGPAPAGSFRGGGKK